MLALTSEALTVKIGLCWRGWVILGLNIRLKSYIYPQHLYTVRGEWFSKLWSCPVQSPSAAAFATWASSVIVNSVCHCQAISMHSVRVAIISWGSCGQLAVDCWRTSSGHWSRHTCHVAWNIVTHWFTGWLTNCFTTFGDQSYAVAGSRTWNSLLNSLRSVDLSTEHFKRALKTFLSVWDRSASVTLFKARRV